MTPPPSPDRQLPRYPDRAEMELALKAQAERERLAKDEADRALLALKRLAARANASGNPNRMGTRTIGKLTGRAGTTVHEWLHGDPATRRVGVATEQRRVTDSRGRCHAVNTGHIGHAGERCPKYAMPGKDNCWHHRAKPALAWDPDDPERLDAGAGGG